MFQQSYIYKTTSKTFENVGSSKMGLLLAILFLSQDRIEFRRMQGKIRKMITEEKNKSWEKTCSTVETTWVVNEAQKHGEY